MNGKPTTCSAERIAKLRAAEDCQRPSTGWKEYEMAREMIRRAAETEEEYSAAIRLYAELARL